MESDARFQKYLKQDESVVWSGRPKRGIQIRDADLILIPMSIIMIGFAIILNYTLLHYESSFVFKMFGVLLAGAGIYVGILRFFTDASRRAHTFYCITTRRVLILVANKKQRIRTLPLKNIDRMDKILEKDGSGFIIFGATNPLFPWLFGGFYFTQSSVPGLELLPDVELVYRIISDLLKVPVPPDLIEEINKDNKGEQN